MQLALLDIVIFVVFVVTVITIGLLKSRHTASGEDYFLAGRNLNWLLIGFSLIAANISAEQFVGMSGAAARGSIGLAIASYEWIAAVTLVIVAFYFLPTFLRSGIFTIPEFLEYRFNRGARTIMSLLMVVIYVGVTIATVVYLGARALDPLFGETLLGVPVNLTTLSWGVGIAAAIYVAAGGLRACAWADLLQGSALILGGAVIMILAFVALDRPERFEGIDVEAVNRSLNLEADATFGEKFARLKDEHMHMVLPRDSQFLPWTALLLGIWIPNLYYWGLNQFIMQRTLAARTLAEGQKGVVFAASLKLLIPFIVCVPGIIAFTLYGPMMHDRAMTDGRLNRPILAEFEELESDPVPRANVVFPFDEDFAAMQPEWAARVLAFNARIADVPVPEGDDIARLNREVIDALKKADSQVEEKQELIGYDYDGAFPLLIRHLTPIGLRGFVIAALMGAVISSLASMLNAASTIFTMDIYRTWFHARASQKTLVWVGRACVPVCVVIGCLIAPQLANPRFRGAFNYIQEFQGFVSPGILSIFLFGLFVRRSPRVCGVLGLVLSPVIYGALFFGFAEIAFLNRMAITVGAIIAVLTIATLFRPMRQPVTLPRQSRIAMEESKGAKVFGVAVVAVTGMLYLIFW